MSRPITSGTHTVPKEVSALKPKNIPCDIKVVLTQSQDSGFHKHHYYVYESARTGSGKIIGKIEGGKFCPNKRYIALFQKDDGKKKAPDPDNLKKPGIHNSKAVPPSNLSGQELDAVKETAVSLNLNIDEIALQLKDYGEYAMVLACTGAVLERLEKYFSDKDARLIYALSIIYFV